MIETLRLQLLRAAGRFADEGEGQDGGGGDAGDDAGGDTDNEGGQDGGDAGEDSQGPVPYSRFATVVSERETARRKLSAAEKKAQQLERQLADAGGEDEAKALRTQISNLQSEVDTVNDEFTALLEAELENLPESSRALVEDLPGGSRDRYRYLVKHRARLSGAASSGEEGGDEKESSPKGAKHERKPEGGEKPGPSSRAKSYVDRQKSQSGWGAVAG